MRLSKLSKIKKKYMYLLIVLVITLLGIVIVPTYAKFAEGFTTSDDVVGFSLDFDVEITHLDQYEEIILEEGEHAKFNVNITNSTGATAYYGIWYKLVAPSEMPDDGRIQIGKLEGTSVNTSGSIDNGSDITASIGILNEYQAEVKLYVGVASSATSAGDIEYLNGKQLISGTVSIPRDINITSIVIDGTTSDSLPTSGYYTMESTCTKGSTLSWEPLSKTITYGSGSQIGDKCSLTFTSSTEYPLLNTMPVGSYVAYVGQGGTVGSTSVACKINGEASSSTVDDETEAPNSCLGQNAREDLDTSGFTYGYCDSAAYKYYTKGWRIAYIDSNNKPVIVSAGSPECNTRESYAGNATYIKKANSLAMKYCNSSLVDGNCSCLDSNSDGYCDRTDRDNDGLCDEIENGEVDAWAINDIDFYNMTKAISGVGKRITMDSSSSLGDSGGMLGTTLYCYAKNSYEECGYNNDLIDNGGWYWFASRDSSSATRGVYWDPSRRYVFYNSSTDAYGLRPVISLSSSVYVTGGSGTMDDPYTISK